MKIILIVGIVVGIVILALFISHLVKAHKLYSADVVNRLEFVERNMGDINRQFDNIVCSFSEMGDRDPDLWKSVYDKLSSLNFLIEENHTNIQDIFKELGRDEEVIDEEVIDETSDFKHEWNKWRQ